MQDCFANIWVGTAVRVCGESNKDKRTRAKIECNQALEHMTEMEETIKADLSKLSLLAKIEQRNHRKAALHNLLVQSRQKRQNLGAIASKKQLIETQLQSLYTGELNSTIVQSMKQTSQALKSLGLTETLSDADSALLDMEENMHDINSLQTSLSQPDAFSDNDLEQELELLLSSDNEMTVLFPANTNSMHDPGRTPANTNSMHDPASVRPETTPRAVASDTARLTPVLEAHEGVEEPTTS